MQFILHLSHFYSTKKKCTNYFVLKNFKLNNLNINRDDKTEKIII